MIVHINKNPKYKQRAIIIDIFHKCHIGIKLITSPMKFHPTHAICFRVNGKAVTLYPIAYIVFHDY